MEPTPKDLSQANQVPVVVRMPAELYHSIKWAASVEERSMAQTIRHALRVYVKSTQQPQ